MEQKKTKQVIPIPDITAKIFSDFMQWGGVGLTIDFNGLLEVIGNLEKKGYVVVIDCEETYLHYPKSAKDKKCESFNNKPKIQGVYRACLTAIKHYYHY